MKAIVSLHVEVLDGPDKGYVLDEQARCVMLERSLPKNLSIGYINPYKISLEFMTPSLFEEARTGISFEHIEDTDYANNE